MEVLSIINIFARSRNYWYSNCKRIMTFIPEESINEPCVTYIPWLKKKKSYFHIGLCIGIQYVLAFIHIHSTLSSSFNCSTSAMDCIFFLDIYMHSMHVEEEEVKINYSNFSFFNFFFSFTLYCIAL